MSQKLSVVGILAGDLEHQLDMKVKYGVFFDVLAQHVDLIEVYDASLHGIRRYLNALKVFHPSRHIWKERFFKNVSAFKARSKKVAVHLRSFSDKIDVVLQLGALFDAAANDSGLPVVVYTDNTTQISARHPEAGRMCFTEKELVNWLALEKKLYQTAHHIAVRSNFIRTSLMQDYDVPEQKNSIIGGGVNFSSFPPKKIRAHSENPVILFIGLDFYRKGGEYVLKAFSLVRDQFPSSRLLIVTEGPILTGLPLENVEVIKPVWERETIASLYRQSDIFVLPSRQETWGDVLLEAMAFCLPCIGVTGQAMETIIEDGKTGYLVPPEDSDALAQALLKLMIDPDKRLQMGRESQKQAKLKFTWEHVVEKLLPILTG